jgi:predicted ester cyclase
MMAQSNGKLMQEIYNLFSNDQFDAVLTRAADDVEIFFAPTEQRFQGHKGFKQFMMGFKGAFPNIKIIVKNQVVTEDTVVTEFTAVGAQTGPLMTPQGEIPPTGRTAEWPVCEVCRFRNGKLSGLNNYQDFGSVLRQLGVM